jgi:flagellar transcriptional activator FlhD
MDAKSEQMMMEIRELNLSFLMLAQAMVRTQKAEALFRLGLSEPVADLLAQMSPQQIVRIASRNLMLCTLRFDDETIWGLLTDRHAPTSGEESTAKRLHASVLMAAQRPAAFA